MSLGHRVIASVGSPQISLTYKTPFRILNPRKSKFLLFNQLTKEEDYEKGTGNFGRVDVSNGVSTCGDTRGNRKKCTKARAVDYQGGTWCQAKRGHYCCSAAGYGILRSD
jgi:hypothetical protein